MIPNNIKCWKPTQLFYVDYIDKDLTWHLFLHYLGETKEVYRVDINGNQKIAYNLYRFTNLAGWRPYRQFWLKEKPDMQETYYKCEYPSVCIQKHFYNKKQMIRALPQLQYVYPNRYDVYNLHEFIRVLRKYPEMESVYKNEQIRHLWHDTRIYNLKPEIKKLFINYVRTHKKTWCETLNDIMFAIKHPEIKNKVEMAKYQEKSYFKRKLPKNVDYEYFVNRYHKLINKYGKKWVFQEYTDYLEMMKELKVRENLYPRDLEKAHNDLIDLKAYKDSHWRILTKKLYKKYSDCLPKNDKYKLYIPQEQCDLIDLGNKFNNCVGSCGYGEDEKEGKCLIVAVFGDKKPVACCELNPKKKYKIEQIYAPSNKPLRSKPARLFVNQFINKVKEARI